MLQFNVLHIAVCHLAVKWFTVKKVWFFGPPCK